MPGGGKCARIQLTAQDGRTTRISCPEFPNTITLAGGKQYAYVLCARDLRKLDFRTVVYNQAKQLATPIDLNRLYENQVYQLCNHMALLA